MKKKKVYHAFRTHKETEQAGSECSREQNTFRTPYSRAIQPSLSSTISHTTNHKKRNGRRAMDRFKRPSVTLAGPLSINAYWHGKVDVRSNWKENERGGWEEEEEEMGGEE